MRESGGERCNGFFTPSLQIDPCFSMLRRLGVHMMLYLYHPFLCSLSNGYVFTIDWNFMKKNRFN